MEPYVTLINGQPKKPAYYQPAPLAFKDPHKIMSLIPVDESVLSGERDFYTVDEMKANETLLKSAYDNTARNMLRKFTDEEFLSVRSAKTGIPCAAAFMLSTKNMLFQALSLDISQYYIIFITYDEVMLAEKEKFKPAAIRKTVTNIRNKMSSVFKDASPVLCTEVFVYDKENDRYEEV